jgi:hypothetical protein
MLVLAVSTRALIGWIAGVVAGLLRWLASLWTRKALRRGLFRLHDVDFGLRRVVIELDETFTYGVDWRHRAACRLTLG